MFLAFVALKMRARVRCSCGAADNPAAERAELLALAAQLFRAAGNADRPFKAPAGWRGLPAGAYTPPTLSPDEGLLRSPRSPAEAAAHLEALAARSPWSAAREVIAAAAAKPGSRSLTPPQASSSSGTLLGGSGGVSVTVGAAVPERSSASRHGPASEHSHWPAVRDMVRSWRRRGSASGGGEAVSAAQVLLRGGPGSLAAQPWPGCDVESQKGEVPLQLPEARALTWSQLGLVQSPSASRRVSENGSVHGARRPPLPPQPLPPALGEVHLNPVFAPYEWSLARGDGAPGSAAGSFTQQVAAAAAAATAAGAAGSLSAGTAGSFSQQVRRLPSRLSRGASFNDPASSDPGGEAGLEGSGHGRREGGSLGHSSGRRSSLLHHQGAAWGPLQAEAAHAPGMRTRPSEQSLLQSQGEPDGLGRILE
ncbi:hypothetical protein C2E20_5151 [Micractinium conductrix]|uniref:Uncharacterized protein n=1 Tax=Micractinium conductrix TaxID=554055 RepID=A0A2P6VBT1_9CHLO|nr:hypothetical protein C2E20_5151 [Micractinium conductrix]|eukprot:PSC71544.1 hypothetical protein C2E20_5151 [Micractinium conductrix]